MDNFQSHSELFSEEKTDVLKAFLHACMDEVCGYPGPSYQKFVNRIEWSKEEYQAMHKLISMIFQNPASLYLSEEKMPPEFHEFPEHVQKTIFSCLEVRKEQLTKALLKKYSKSKLQTLVDFDWRLKLVLGSSKLMSLREPLLQLDLIIEDRDNQLILDLELNKDDLDTLINTLETVTNVP